MEGIVNVISRCHERLALLDKIAYATCMACIDPDPFRAMLARIPMHPARTVCSACEVTAKHLARSIRQYVGLFFSR